MTYAAAAVLVAPLGTAPALAAEPTAGEPAATTQEHQLGTVTGFHVDGDRFTIDAGPAAAKVTFLSSDVFRIQVSPDGAFTDPNDPPADPDDPDARMVIKTDWPGGHAQWTDDGDYYALSTDSVTVRVYKDPLHFAAYRPDGSLIFAETQPITWDGDGTTQTLSHQHGEQFFGGGEQNGSFIHTGQTIHVANNFNWNEGGYNNSQPFYLSTAGYGVFRDTFSPGTYDFGTPVRTTESEQRFDGYYFIGQPKSVIGDYTELVGKPLMPPEYGLEMGDSDCYLHNANRGERHTLDALDVADGYVSRGIPLGWMLVNDGYGCGYEDLDQVGQGLRDRDIELGLWTSTGLPNQAAEVKAGVRVRKLDVGWVGPGYRFALDAGQTAFDGIENNSDARGYVWQPVSWAGSQRTSVLWSGDQSGSWDYIRWQIPTYAGSTMSGIAYNTGDIDGIFGGSAKTYVRDLQWKSMLPVTMSMDGWAATDKQPWRYGQPYTSINKKYMLLHERLLPYFYTYSADAHRSGVGMVRPLALEYPNDPTVYTDTVKEEFLSGEDFLVAPVYSDTDTRNGIYLPEGTWVDYWTGRVYHGPTTIDGYHAPLDTLPLFVKGGAIVPMYAEGTTDWSDRDTSELDLDVYPAGDSTFTLYEDDGHTRAYQDGASAQQTFTVHAPDRGPGNVTVQIGPSRGDYAGKPAQRHYQIAVHTGTEPANVQAGTGPGHQLRQYRSETAYDNAETGWWYDASDGGTVHVKTGDVPATGSLTVRLHGTSAVGGRHDSDQRAAVAVQAPAISPPGAPQQVTASFTNNTAVPVRNVTLTLQLPDGWTADSGSQSVHLVHPGDTVRRTFTVTPADDSEPGSYRIGVSAAYTARSQTHTVRGTSTTTVPYAGISAAFNNVAITDQATLAKGDFDGTGGSFSADQLHAVGVDPGSTVTADGFDYIWPDTAPGTPDNVAAQGQTIAITGSGTQLGLLGSEAGFATGTVTVHYADGTTHAQSVGFPNWCCSDTTAYGSTVAITTHGKNTPEGLAYPSTAYRVFSNHVRLLPDKHVVAVTLPSSSAIHVFAMAIATKPLPKPPTGDVYASDLDWLSASNDWGPVERDTSNGESAGGDGHTITLDGVTYAKGLGINAPADIAYYVGGQCSSFTADVGIDDEIPDYGSVIFRVVADGRVVYSSDVLTGTSPTESVDVDVSGARYIDLVADPTSDGAGGDHGDWADAQFHCAG